MTKRFMKYVLQIFDDSGNLIKEQPIYPSDRPKLTEAIVTFNLTTPTGTEQVTVVIKAKPQTNFQVYSGVWGFSTNTQGAANFRNLSPDDQIARIQRQVNPKTKTPEPERDRVRAQGIIARILDEKINDDHVTWLELGIPVHEVFQNAEPIESKKPKKKKKKKSEDEDQGTL